MQKQKLFNQLSRMTLIKKHHSTTNITVALSKETIKKLTTNHSLFQFQPGSWYPFQLDKSYKKTLPWFVWRRIQIPEIAEKPMIIKLQPDFAFI